MPAPKLGVQNVLRNTVDSRYPLSFAETPSGLLLMANGLDPMLKWDGLSAFADTAGIAPPASACELGGVGIGMITGRLVAYVRFTDALGNVSDLSPLSNVMDAGRDGLIDTATFSRQTGAVTIRSDNHGLATGDAVIIDGVEGLIAANGQWAITVVDENTFALDGLVSTSEGYTQGGSWTKGVRAVVYGAVPPPAETKVVGRQILRNLNGNLTTLYVDIDTTDLESTAFMSTTPDGVLMAGEPVPLFYRVAAPPAPDGELPFASRHGVPPTHKSVIEPHKGRVFAAVDAVYTDGHAEVAFNRTLVQGVGTEWRTTFVGRLIYFDGATKPYQIAAIDEESQQATLTAPFLDPPKPYCFYAIQPDPAERRLLYYSEPELPESWPAYNAVSIPEDNDTLSGLISLGQYLYLIERRHIYRCTYQADPSDGMVFLCSQRGSLSNRTYAVTDDGVLCLDEIGIHKFDPGTGQSQPISTPIQNVFQGDGTSDIQVDWSQNQTLWHAAHDPVRDTVRWFLGMVGWPNLRHCIAYNYRTDRFWIEEYPTPISASTNATLGSRRSLAGTEGRRIVCLAEGSYEGVDGTGTLRGTATSADAVSIGDTSAEFHDLEGAAIAIVSGKGAGQQGIIAFNSPTAIGIVQPWTTIPDTTSVYQVGGIPWAWRSGWFRYVDEEDDNPRDVEVIFKPLVNQAFLDVRLFYDHSPSPRAWSRDIAQDGVQTKTDSPIIEIDLSATRGWARQRISGHGNAYAYADRFVSVEMAGVQAGEPVRISQVVISGVEQ